MSNKTQTPTVIQPMSSTIRENTDNMISKEKVNTGGKSYSPAIMMQALKIFPCELFGCEAQTDVVK